MRVIVQKFGGTSLADSAGRDQAAAHVLEARDAGYQPVVVVSAMGRHGDPYATDTLLSLLKDGKVEPERRDVDFILSCGEIISAAVMAQTLKNAGLNAHPMNGIQAGIQTDGEFTRATVRRVDPEPVFQALERYDGVVVAGFQGASAGGEMTTLGRGGSDTTAAALGVSLGAEKIEIYTDVDGVKTADPSLVDRTRTLKVMSYEELAQMAHEGAKVIHPQAVEMAMKGRVPMEVRANNGQDRGTRITGGFRPNRRWPGVRTGRVITGVTQLTDMTQIVIDSGGSDLPSNRKIFAPLAEASISVDMINVFPDRKAFIVERDDAEQAVALLKESALPVQVQHSVAKVSIVGMAMRGLPGVMANVVEALEEDNIEILQTVDSHVTISCLIHENDLTAAVNRLHQRFQLAGEEDDEEVDVL